MFTQWTLSVSSRIKAFGTLFGRGIDRSGIHIGSLFFAFLIILVTLEKVCFFAAQPRDCTYVKDFLNKKQLFNILTSRLINLLI